MQNLFIPPDRPRSGSIVQKKQREKYSQPSLLRSNCYVNRECEKLRFSTGISLFLGNYTRYGHSYNGRQTETSTRLLIGVNSNELEWTLFHKLSILSIYDLCLLQILVFVYKSINLLLPNSYTQYFTRTSDIHYYKTRGHKYNLYKINAQKTCRTNCV